MKFSLYQRLSVSLFLVFIVLIGSFYFWQNNLTKVTRYQSQQQLHLSLAANLARDNPLLQKGVYDHDALKNLFHTLMILGPAFEFYYLDTEGNVLTHSIPTTLLKREKIDLTPLIDLTQNRRSLPIYGDDPRNKNRKKVFSAAPVFNGATLQGYLYVIVAGERYESTFNNHNQDKRAQMSLAFIATAVGFLFIIMLGLFAYFTKPLRKLSSEMKALKSAGFDKSKVQMTSWQHKSNNEVHQLGETFHELIDQINQQFSLLAKSDQQRRELLADISHDLRTPLAALQGYLETISLNHKQLNEDKLIKYIDTAHASAQQLKLLIDQIFELAHLEGGQVSMNLESFNIAELLYDVFAKFSLKAQAKNISLTVSPNTCRMQVQSDIGKLERVLSNLIDNAIRHTPEGGNIDVQIKSEDNHNAILTVKDNGTGIKSEELAYIFDARYRASNATHTEENNTGLGLAITKKLLELLNTDVKVESTLGKGTAFSFKLRVAS